MGAMFGNLDHTSELEAPSVRAGRFTNYNVISVDQIDKSVLFVYSS